MTEPYLKLPREEQANILRAVAPVLGQTPTVIEKDVWVCWVLKQLFEMPNRLPMAFKGGTSLSKIFQAISRFSEDVDITLDYRNLDPSVDPFDTNLSRSQLKKLSDHLKARVHKHVSGTVVPFLLEQLAADLDDHAFDIAISEDGESVRIHYPTALAGSGGYIPESVLIEFGGRNITEPSGGHLVRPYLADAIEGLHFPSATVVVLAAERTFWEKATLIHVECHRTEFRTNAERLSRHWYDLAMLAQHAIGKNALGNRALLEDVVQHKKVFFHAGHASYDACLRGALQLIPGKVELAALQTDFEKMVGAGMFFLAPPSFAEIVDRLRRVETEINAATRDCGR